MVDQIEDRRTSEKQERNDLFSSLLDASDEEDLSEGGAKLSTRELLGQLFHCRVNLSALTSLIL